MDVNILFDLYVVKEGRRHGEEAVILPSIKISKGEAIHCPSACLPESLEKVKFVFIPMVYKDHWILVVVGKVDLRLGLKVYDSFKMLSSSFQHAVSTLEDWLRIRYSIRLRRTHWASCTQQSRNSLSCGIFIVAYALAIIHDSSTFGDDCLELEMNFDLLLLRDTLTLQLLRVIKQE